MKKHIITGLTLLFLVLAATAAQAAMTTANFTGTITAAADGNVFGVSLGDTFTWSATYDLETYLASDNWLVIGDSEDMALSVTVGSRTFVETDDDFYGSGDFGAPVLKFDDAGTITGISFTVMDTDNGYQFVTDAWDGTFAIYLLDDEGEAEDNAIVEGAFSFSPAAVPVPGTALLLGSGLLGLLGAARRKKA